MKIKIKCIILGTSVLTNIETFGKRKAKKLLKKIKFIYTPKHASWLNMAEIEIDIMHKQCTDGRI
jgi:hypothetical protein